MRKRKEKHHHTYIFEGVDILGCTANIEVEYTTEVVDNGIGAYEFWGTDYTDTQLEHETIEAAVVYLWWCADEGEQSDWATGEVITDDARAFVDAAVSYVEANHEVLDKEANSL